MICLYLAFWKQTRLIQSQEQADKIFYEAALSADKQRILPGKMAVEDT